MKSSAPTKSELNRALYGKGKRTNPETPIVNSCIEYLNVLPGVRCWRNNVGGAVFENAEGEKRLVKFGFEGMSDIFGVQRITLPETHALTSLEIARFISIEVKVPGKEPDAEQQAWLAQMLEMGAVAFYCDSLESCIEQAEKWGLS